MNDKADTYARRQALNDNPLVQRAVQRLHDSIACRETTLDLEAIKAVLVEMAHQKERADKFERRVVKAELESEELARRIGDQSGRLATASIERDCARKALSEVSQELIETRVNLQNAKADAESYRATANRLAERVASLEQQLEETQRMVGE